MDSYKRSDKKRLLAVFNHEIPDRVPNFEVLVGNPALRHVMGREIKGRHTLANIDPGDYMEFAQKIGQDVIGMCFYDNPFRYVGPDNEIRRLDFHIKSRADLDSLLPVSMNHLDMSFKLLEDYEKAIKGTDLGLFVLTGDFFCTSYTNIFGFDNFMYLLYDDRDLIDEVLEIYSDYYARLVERLVQHDLTFFYIGDDIAYKTGTLINPCLIRELWLPRMERIMAPVLRKGIPLLFHSDGNIIEMLPDLIEMGISAVNPVEPYGMDIVEVKRKFGRNLTLVGNIDVGGVLSTGTPDQVRRECSGLIEKAGKDGGLVLASSHSITANVKPENFLAMVETAQNYRYR